MRMTPQSFSVSAFNKFSIQMTQQMAKDRHRLQIIGISYQALPRNRLKTCCAFPLYGKRNLQKRHVDHTTKPSHALGTVKQGEQQKR